MENVKKHMEALMLYVIDGDMFHSFRKSIWIGKLGASCHITDNTKAFMTSSI